MSQNIYFLENQSGFDFRFNLNVALEKIAENNSSSSPPDPSYPNQWWYDTQNNELKIRDNSSQNFYTIAKNIGGNYLLLARSGSQIINVSGDQIDCSLGNYFDSTINSNTGYNFANAPAGVAYSFTLRVKVNGSHTITFDNTVKWINNVTPTLEDSKTHLFMFVTQNQGNTWYGSALINYSD